MYNIKVGEKVYKVTFWQVAKTIDPQNGVYCFCMSVTSHMHNVYTCIDSLLNTLLKYSIVKVKRKDTIEKAISLLHITLQQCEHKQRVLPLTIKEGGCKKWWWKKNRPSTSQVITGVSPGNATTGCHPQVSDSQVEAPLVTYLSGQTQRNQWWEHL